MSAALLQEATEKDLYAALQSLAPEVHARVEQRRFGDALAALAGLRDPVDRFFADVRVVVPDAALRTNRFALLNALNRLLNSVANISRLPA